MNSSRPKVCILTIQEKFSRGINYHTSLDVRGLQDILASASIDSYVSEIERAVNCGLEPGTSHVLFGGHPNPEASEYMFDYALSLEGTVTLLPRLELILCYENKGLQGLIADKYSAAFAKQRYYYSLENSLVDRTVVYKTISGAGSSGVSLVSTAQQLRRIHGLNRLKGLTYTTARHLLRYGLGKLLRGDHEALIRYRYMQPYSRYVLQQYISGQEFDYKALVFGDRVYVLKRFTRDHDFRASGSGKFIFVEVENGLLDFALNFCRQINAPFLSIDIVPCDSDYQAIEFQAIHFGAYTQLKAPFFYQHTAQGWKKIKATVSLEQCYAESVAAFISQ